MSSPYNNFISPFLFTKPGSSPFRTTSSRRSRYWASVRWSGCWRRCWPGTLTWDSRWVVELMRIGTVRPWWSCCSVGCSTWCKGWSGVYFITCILIISRRIGLKSSRRTVGRFPKTSATTLVIERNLRCTSFRWSWDGPESASPHSCPSS